MNVLVIAPTPFFSDRGTHIRILEEAKAIRDQGHTVTIATYHIGRDLKAEELGERLHIKRIRPWLFWYTKTESGPSWQKLILDWQLMWLCVRLLFGKVDVVHAHLHEGALLGWKLRLLLFWKRFKFITDFHGTLVSEMTGHGYLRLPLAKRFMQWIERRLHRFGDVAFVSSAENTQRIAQQRDGKTTVHIPDGVSISKYDLLESREQLRQKLQLPENSILVGYVGAPTKTKGIDYLLNTIYQIINKRPHVHFLVAGHPADYVTAQVKEMHLEKHVTIIDTLPYTRVPEILAACDIAVDPKDDSTQQASGKILEYMAAGLPVACFERPTNRTYLGEDVAMSPNVSAEGLEAAIRALVENEHRAELGSANRERVKQFSWEDAGVKMNKHYQ